MFNFHCTWFSKQHHLAQFAQFINSSIHWKRAYGVWTMNIFEPLKPIFFQCYRGQCFRLATIDCSLSTNRTGWNFVSWEENPKNWFHFKFDEKSIKVRKLSLVEHWYWLSCGLMPSLGISVFYRSADIVKSIVNVNIFEGVRIVSAAADLYKMYSRFQWFNPLVGIFFFCGLIIHH